MIAFNYHFTFILTTSILTQIVLSEESKWPWRKSNSEVIKKKSWRFLDSEPNVSENLSTAENDKLEKYSDDTLKKSIWNNNKTRSSKCSSFFIEDCSNQNKIENDMNIDFSTISEIFKKFPGESLLKEEKLENLFEQKLRDSISSNSTHNIIYNKMTRRFELGDGENSQNKITTDEMEKMEKLVNDTESRIIPIFINATRASGQNYPSITLAKIARGLMFPNWLWSKLALNRRAGVGLSNLNLTNVQFAPLLSTAATPKLPTVTFDTNYGRFVKLFSQPQPQVSSTVQNTDCVGSNGRNGTCYLSSGCTSLGGTASGTCAAGLGVCCIFSYTCGGSTSQNISYFINSSVNYSSTGVTTCSFDIAKNSSAVKQIRLDFEIFSLRQPNAGNCENDRFVVSGQNINNVLPILCGTNNNTHVYVETEGSSTGIKLSVMTKGSGTRYWRIRITQFTTTSPSSAPPHCLQYETGVVGTIKSFNYVSNVSPQYLNNLNYAICIRKEAGFCSVTFTNGGPDGTYMPFQIVNANEHGSLFIPSGQAGVGVRDCPFDYVLINGNRLCGERFNDAMTNVLFFEDAPVTDNSNGPFIVTVRTNDIDVGGGFFLYYRQNPCWSKIL